MITDVGAIPFTPESRYTTGRPGFVGWVKHWIDDIDWWNIQPDAE